MELFHDWTITFIEEELSMTNDNDTTVLQTKIQELIEELGPASADLIQKLADPEMHTVDGYSQLFFHAAIRLKEAQEKIEAYEHHLAVFDRVRSIMGRGNHSEHDQHDLEVFGDGFYPLDFDAEGKFIWDADDIKPFKAV